MLLASPLSNRHQFDQTTLASFAGSLEESGLFWGGDEEIYSRELSNRHRKTPQADTWSEDI